MISIVLKVLCYFLFDKLTAGAYNFLSVILNSNLVDAIIAGLASAFTVISAKAQFLDEVKINSTSQLISGIFKLLLKLLKYFSAIITSV